MFTNYQKRIFLFLFGCIGLRTLFVYVAKNIDKKYLPQLGYLALIPVIGWLYIYFVGSRNSGPEVFGGKIWWNELRVPHAMLYTLFAIYAIQKKSFSWIPLLIDVLLGLTAFTVYHKQLFNIAI
jgi:hypothetical protein